LPQWEYCSIQYVDGDGLIYFFYRTQSLESQILYKENLSTDRGSPPRPVQPMNAGFPTFEWFVEKFSQLQRASGYQADRGAEELDHVLSKVSEITSKYVAMLGLQGWEAIHLIRLPNGLEHWYFKRQVQSSNQYLIF
jgi:hypothetical protein